MSRQNSTTSSPDDSVHPSRQQFTGGDSTPFNSTYTDFPLLEEEELPSEDDTLTVSGSGSVTRAQTGTETRTPAQTQIRTRGYNTLKTHQGQIYTGMAIGGSHTWNYDPGIWKETKEEPDRWRIDYATNKRRARSAPTGSGAPVGTEYHWLIVAHQVSVKVKMGKQESDVAHVRKIDANTYETHLKGTKYKLAHKSTSSESWSIPTVRGQRDRELELLEDAKRRVQGLPPVLTTEKVKMDRRERGQQSLDHLLGWKAMCAEKDGVDIRPRGLKRRRGSGDDGL
ncbi:hypothetical protein PDE_02059 [Penicillium oxalicum 114-2]|uniref:Uncharacterized protein n=1 Tax=Penicillium oxalicum (strain 114-2 / CGMCC 5302) TaxID=933388 RepID=S8AMK1_PENO1|nr:hypothetical protein PDE_02059 [Penicillium oxalicum 114-2]